MNYANDTALFISFTTMPFGREESFVEDIKSIFDGYREKQLQEIGGVCEQEQQYKNQFEKYFYKPSFYCLLGNFDLAVVSLSDDYTLATRNFHPYSYFMKKKMEGGTSRMGEYADNFKFQIITGTSPMLETAIGELKRQDSSEGFYRIMKKHKLEDLYTKKEVENNFRKIGKDAFLIKFIETYSFRENPLINKAKETFLHKGRQKEKEVNRNEQDGAYPFIGISRIKLNTGLTIGAGAKFVGLVEEELYDFLTGKQREFKEGNNKVLEKTDYNSPEMKDEDDCLLRSFDFIITESVGWHELTVTFFSNDLKTISDLVVEIREWRLSNFKKRDESRHLVDFVTQESLMRSIFDLEKEIYQSSLNPKTSLSDIDSREGLYDERYERELVPLIKKYINDYKDERPADFEVDETQVFLQTLTTFGFDMEYMNSLEEGQQNKYFNSLYTKNDTEEKYYMKWSVKPGNLSLLLDEFRKGIEKENKDIEIDEEIKTSFLSGPEDYIFPTHDKKQELRNIMKIHESLINLKEKKLHGTRNYVKKINSLASFTYSFDDLNKKSAVSHNIYYSHLFEESLKILAFSLGEIKEIRKLLYRCNVSKIIREKVLNIYVNYNDSIQDISLFPFFMGLRPYLEELKNALTTYGEDSEMISGDEVLRVINGMVDQFEHAYRNRFNQSYRMDGIIDNNIEFNGPAQGIIFSLEGAYKATASVFVDNPQNPASFVYSTGMSTVDSSKYSMRLNYFHVFQPCLFFSPLIKETANQMFEYYHYGSNSYADEYSKGIKDLMDPCARKIFKTLQNSNKGMNTLAFADEKEIKRDLIRSLISDISSFYYGFNGDVELYYNWYWAYFLQMSEMYDTDNALSVQPFVRFLSRFIIVMKFTEHKEDLSEFYKDVEKNIAYPTIPMREKTLLLFPFLNELFSDDFLLQTGLGKILANATSWVLLLMSQDLINKECENTVDSNNDENKKKIEASIDNYHKGIMESERADKEEFIKNIDEKQNSYYYNSLAKSAYILRGKKIEDLPKAEQDQIEEIATHAAIRSTLALRRSKDMQYVFGVGEIYQYKFQSLKEGVEAEDNLFANERPSFYVHCLSFGYLKLIYDEMIKEKDRKTRFGRIATVPRYDFDVTIKKEGKEIKRHKGQVANAIDGYCSNNEDTRNGGSDLYFDSMGGLIIPKFEVRRKYFKYRSTLIRSLWDFTCKYYKDFLISDK